MGILISLKDKKMDKMEETFRKKLSYSYMFDERIERVVSLWTNSLVYKNLYSNFLEEINFIKGESFAEKGAKTIARCKLDLTFQMEVMDVEKREDYTKIVLDHSLIDNNTQKLKSTEIHHFYWNTVQCQTILITEIVVYEETFYNYLKTEKNEEERMNIYKKFDDYIKRMPYCYEQAESVIIQKDQETIWPVITNFELFKNYAPGLGDYVKYDGDPLKENTILHVYFNDNTKEFHLKVIKHYIEEEKRVYGLSYFAGLPKAPCQDLFFILIKFAENKSLLIFKHVFNKYVKFKLIKKIADEKKQLLKTLKESFEKDNI